MAAVASGSQKLLPVMGGGAAHPEPESTALVLDKHKQYVLRLQEERDSFEYCVTEHLRMSGVYWGLSAMALMGCEEEMERAGIVGWLFECQHKQCGGFGGNVGHDPHILYTLSAVQILAIYDELSKLDIELVAKYISSLQQEDGSFAGDEWGEIDTRFSYCALNCLRLINRMDAVDVDKACEYIGACANFDGGFGCIPGAESHSGQIFTCVGALAIAGALHHVKSPDLLGWWLAERQTKSGGLNGRPEKLHDVCYSWWVISALQILGRVHWIDQGALSDYILRCQDAADGGIADRPGDVSDVFHTFFGLAGLSMLGESRLEAIDPVYAMPVKTLERLGIPCLYSERGEVADRPPRPAAMQAAGEKAAPEPEA